MTVVHHQAFRHRALSHGPPRTSAATVAPRMGEVEIVGIDCPLSRSARKPSRVLDDDIATTTRPAAKLSAAPASAARLRVRAVRNRRWLSNTQLIAPTTATRA